MTFFKRTAYGDSCQSGVCMKDQSMASRKELAILRSSPMTKQIPADTKSYIELVCVDLLAGDVEADAPGAALAVGQVGAALGLLPVALRPPVQRHARAAFAAA